MREGIFLLGMKWKLFTLAILIILLISIQLTPRVPLFPAYLLQLSIPFDFATKICKSETYISPEILIFKLQVLKGRREKALTFKSTVNALIHWRSLTSIIACPIINALSTFTNVAFVGFFPSAVTSCKILNSCQDRSKNYNFLKCARHAEKNKA